MEYSTFHAICSLMKKATEKSDYKPAFKLDHLIYNEDIENYMQQYDGIICYTCYKSLFVDSHRPFWGVNDTRSPNIISNFSPFRSSTELIIVTILYDHTGNFNCYKIKDRDGSRIDSYNRWFLNMHNNICEQLIRRNLVKQIRVPLADPNNAQQISDFIRPPIVINRVAWDNKSQEFPTVRTGS
jgi:hypothetical protein